MSNANTRDIHVSTAMDGLEKSQLEKVADAYDCSQSAAIRHLVTERFNDFFGDVHPEALDRHDVNADELVSGEVSPDEIDDDLKMSGDGPAQVPATDGGMAEPVSPSSYTPTFTPSDLQTSGVALSWDELKGAVERHWSDSLEIHPDRVEPERLKNNQKVVSKILAGVIRSESEVASDPLIDQKIEEYLGHQVRRADYDSGIQYKINQYKPLIREHFVTHPNEEFGSQYVTPEAKEDGIPHLFTLIEADLEQNVAAVDFDTWRKVNHVSDPTIGDVENWVDDLADFRSAIDTLSTIVSDNEFNTVLRESDLEYPDEYENPLHYASGLLKKRLRSYESSSPYARYVAVKTSLELPDEKIREEDIEDEAVIKFQSGDITSKQEQLATVGNLIA